MQRVSKALDDESDRLRHITDDIAEEVAPHCGCLGRCVGKLISWIAFDSPVTMLFVLVNFLVQFINARYPSWNFTATNFAVPPLVGFYVDSPHCWFTVLLGHGIAHKNWAHYHGNMANLLTVMPNCEAHFGSSNVLFIIMMVIWFSGSAHVFLGPSNTAQEGASGVVFAFILLNSLVHVYHKGKSKIPVAFFCQFALWVVHELVLQVHGGGQISHIAHISGAFVGILAGFLLEGRKEADVAEEELMEREQEMKKTN